MGIDGQRFVWPSHLPGQHHHGCRTVSLPVSHRIFAHWRCCSLRHLGTHWTQSKVKFLNLKEILYCNYFGNFSFFNFRYKTEEENSRGIKDESIWNSRTRQLRVDCVGASKGLFMGLFFLTASLLCLVLFFIFVPMPQFKRLGLILGDSAHCTLLLVSLIAMAIGAYRYFNYICFSFSFSKLIFC